MKNYSDYIPSSYGFITRYEIVGEEIHVYTPENKKREPHIYKATKENIAYFEERLENQYKLIIENRGIITEEKAEDIKINTYTISYGLALITVITAIALVSSQASFVLAGTSIISGIVSLVTGKIIVSKKLEKFNNEMDIIKTYINNRKDIETLSKEDENITNYLSFSASKIIVSNDELRKKELLEDTFNVDFMDKTQLKDLKKLLTRYQICKDLRKEQVFITSEEEDKNKEQSTPKKRSRKQEN